MVEIMVAATILSLALAAAISGWLYVFRGERMNSVQNELDMDVRKAMERIRADLRLSAIDQMYYYPAGPGPYTAISLPLARDDDGNNLIERDGNGKIIWDQTVIYHVWSGTPNELRKTTFDPRNTSRTPAEMQAQIDSVVEKGDGSSTYDSSTATTIPIFQNLFDWKIYAKGAQHDSYLPQVSRDINVVFGSALLASGSHSLTFKVVGKNAASTGYGIGIDNLVMSPCGVPREAEAQTVSANVGATAAAEYMAGGSWDGNYQMSFPATSTGQYFTLSMENDRWEETNFKTTGAQCGSNACVSFDETYTPKDYVVRCIPQSTNWYATDQTLSLTNANTYYDHLRARAMRVLLRGANMMDGNGIKNSGQFRCVKIRAASNKDLHIVGAYIGTCASETNYTCDAESSTNQLFYNGAGDFIVPKNTGVELTSSVPPYINRDMSYLVSFLVADEADKADSGRWWQYAVSPSNPLPPGCYYIEAADTNVIRAANWSSMGNVSTSQYLYAIESMSCLAESNSTWTSQIVDTHIDAPTYTALTWNEDKPSGTALTMKLRTGNSNDMSDATDWTAITAMTGGGAINPASKRYVQVQAEMWSDSVRLHVPSLKDFTVKWDGETSVADIGGTITQSPSNGVFEILLDGSNIIKRGVTIDLTIFQYVRGFSPGPSGSNMLTSTVSAEVEPRNTGK